MKQLTRKDRQHMWALEWQQSGDERALNSLIESCMGLVYQETAKTRRWSGLEREDLNAEGMIGIVRAAHEYDPERGAFSACAAMWIRYYIRIYARKNWSGMKIPNSRREAVLHSGIGPLVEKHERAGASRQKAIELAASELGVDPLHAERAIQLKAPGRPIGAEHDDSVDPAADESTAEEVCDRGLVQEVLEECLAGLTDRERAIIAARFLSEDTRSLDSLGKQFGVSRERIRQVQNDALEHIRIELRRRGLELKDMI